MDYTAIKNRVYFLAGATSTSYPVADLTSSANRAVERVVSLINQACGWQWDDNNQTDLPIAKATITTNQQDYSLATAHLTIDRVEVKDSSGNWHLLRQIDQQSIRRDLENPLAVGESSRTGAYQASTGIPSEYDLLGSSIFLYPIPNFTQANSLFIYFSRGPVAFDTTDTTDEPGFNSLFHDLVPLWTAYDYCLAKGKEQLTKIFAEIQRKEQEIFNFYGQRNRDFRPRITITTDSNK